MEPKESDIKSEGKKVKKSFELLKKDIKNDPLSFFNEYDLQARLYYRLCNNFDYKKIHLEYNPHTGFDRATYLKNWRKCLKKYGSTRIPKLKDVVKRGRYDLAILDNDNVIKHVIELKRITSYTSDPHKVYEDLYVLTDLLDGYKRCQSYFFVFAICNSKHGVKKERMKEYLKNVNKTYDNTKVNFDYFLYDNSEK